MIVSPSLLASFAGVRRSLPRGRTLATLILSGVSGIAALYVTRVGMIHNPIFKPFIQQQPASLYPLAAKARAV
jgi:hypothetical protein